MLKSPVSRYSRGDAASEGIEVAVPEAPLIVEDGVMEESIEKVMEGSIEEVIEDSIEEEEVMDPDVLDVTKVVSTELDSGSGLSVADGFWAFASQKIARRTSALTGVLEMLFILNHLPG